MKMFFRMMTRRRVSQCCSRAVVSRGALFSLHGRAILVRRFALCVKTVPTLMGMKECFAEEPFNGVNNQTMPETSNRHFWVSIDIFNVLGSAHRLKMLLALKPGRQTVGSLMRMVDGAGARTPGDLSQTSAALAPMRRVGQVN